jgi:hypothetical protein
MRRATALRADAMLARVQLLEAGFESPLTTDAAKIEQLLVTTAETVERAGSPAFAVADLERLRAILALDAGDFASASAHYDAAARASAAGRGEVAPATPQRPIELLWRTFDFDAALAIAQAEYDDALATWGPHHDRTLDTRNQLWRAHYIRGAHTDAIAVLRLAIAEYEAMRATNELLWAYPRLAESALLVGDVALAASSIERTRALRAGDPEPALWLQNMALNSGLYGVAERVLGSIEASTDEREMLVADARAILAYWRRELPAARVDAVRAAALADKLDLQVTSNVYAAGIEAALGNHAAAERRVALLARAAERPAMPRQVALPDGTSIGYRVNALQARGLVAIEERRFADAIAPLQEARSILIRVAQRGTDVADLDAAIARALVETGDVKTSITHLGSALAAIDMCCDGFAASAPSAQLALARALWDSGGDKAIAVRAARTAVAGFRRLGRETDAEVAERWLAEHADADKASSPGEPR